MTVLKEFGPMLMSDCDAQVAIVDNETDVALVDDDPVLAALVRRVLAKQGHSVTRFGDGLLAVGELCKPGVRLHARVMLTARASERRRAASDWPRSNGPPGQAPGHPRAGRSSRSPAALKPGAYCERVHGFRVTRFTARRVGRWDAAATQSWSHSERASTMNHNHQTQGTETADPQRQAAYRRLALTILGLDVPTLAAKLQAARLTPGEPQISQAA